MISSKYSNKPFQSLGQSFSTDRSRDRPLIGHSPQGRPSPPAAPFGPGGSKRWTNFKRMVDLAGGMEIVVAALDMSPGRVRALVEGSAEVDAGLAMHIEEMLGLPGGWLEDSVAFSELPVSAKEAFGLIPRVELTQVSPLQTEPLALPVTPSITTVVDETTAGKAAVNTSEDSSKTSVHSIERKATLIMEAQAQGQSTEQTTLTAVVKKAGRPSLVSPLTELRRTNFSILTNGKGLKMICATRMGVKSAYVSKMISGLKNIDEALARDAEIAMNRESGWLDIDHGFSLALTAMAEPNSALSAAAPKPMVPEIVARVEPIATMATPVSVPVEAQQAPDLPQDEPRVRVIAVDQRPSISYVERKTVVSQLPASSATVPATTSAAAPENEKIGPLAEMLIKIVTSKAQSRELSEELAHKMIGQMLNF